jgi:hypothetical protein
MKLANSSTVPRLERLSSFPSAGDTRRDDKAADYNNLLKEQKDTFSGIM